MVAAISVVIRIIGFMAAFKGSSLLIISVACSDIIITGLIFVGILMLNKLKERVVQTLTAIFGISTILSLLQLPLYFFTDSITINDAAPLTLIFLLLVDIWTLAVIAWIMKNALNTSTGVGIFISVVASFAGKIILMSIYPNFFFPAA